MTPEEKAIQDAIEAKVKEITTAFEAKSISKADFDAKMTEISTEIKSIKDNTIVEDLKKQLSELKEQSDKQGIELSKQATMFNINKGATKSFSEVISDSLKNEEITDFMKKKKGSTNKVDLKVAGDMSEGGNLTAGSILITDQPRRDIIELKTRPVHMRELMSVGTTMKDRIPIVKQANYEDGASQKAENAASDESDFDLVETYVNVERLATHLIVSKDLLEDIPALTSFISNHLPKRMMTKEDQQILFGNGTSPQIAGLTNSTMAFAAGTFSIPQANEIDVLRVALANLNVSYYSPSAIILNPNDIAKIDTLKTGTTREYLGNNYLVSRDANTGLMRIAGIPVIGNTAMTAGKFLLGDFVDAAEILDRKQLTMQMSDSHSDYFIKNAVCITFEERIALPIYYDQAFMYGNFTTAKLAITAGT